MPRLRYEGYIKITPCAPAQVDKEAPAFPEVSLSEGFVGRREFLGALKDNAKGKGKGKKKRGQSPEKPESGAGAETSKDSNTNTVKATAAKTKAQPPAEHLEKAEPESKPKRRRKHINTEDANVEEEAPQPKARKTRKGKAKAAKDGVQEEDVKEKEAEDAAEPSQKKRKKGQGQGQEAKVEPSAKAKAKASTTKADAVANTSTRKPKAKAKASTKDAPNSEARAEKGIEECKDDPECSDPIYQKIVKEVLECLHQCKDAGECYVKGKHTHDMPKLNVDCAYVFQLSVYWSRFAVGIKSRKNNKKDEAQVAYFSQTTPCHATNIILARCWVRYLGFSKSFFEGSTVSNCFDAFLGVWGC